MAERNPIQLMAVVEKAAKFYSNELMRGTGPGRDEARGYVGSRRLFAPMVEQFLIGYVPRSRDRPWILAKLGDPELLLDAGIINQNEEGKLYDPMEGRIVFPQASPAGKYLGFVGRGQGSVRDKYLSTGSTQIFRRAEVLYRIDKARRAIESVQTAIVVEGLIDAALMFQIGIRHVVATGTKSMTDPQAQILARYANKVEIMFDNTVEAREAAMDVIRRRGRFFKSITLRDYPGHYGDPADWVAAQIDQRITDQQAAV